MNAGTPLGAKYEVGELLGSGTMGRVHRCVIRSSGEQRAVKFLRPELASDADVVSRFVQERHVLRGIRHENVVGVHDLVVEDDQLAIVMDLVAGGDMRSLPRPISLQDSLAIAKQLAAGLAAIHSAGVVHRDLKPENVLVDGESGAGRVLITDFGVSRLAGSGLTSTTSMFGTPRYMAPEISEGRPASPAADVYSLGVMLYEMVGNRPPFVADSVMALLRAHSEQPPIRPSGMTDSLWTLVSQMLAKDPSERPLDSQVIEAISQIGGEDVGAATIETMTVIKPPAHPARDAEQLPAAAPKWRHLRRGRAMVGVAVLALVAGGVYIVSADDEEGTVTSLGTGTTTATVAPTSAVVEPSSSVVPSSTGVADVTTAVTPAPTAARPVGAATPTPTTASPAVTYNKRLIKSTDGAEVYWVHNGQRLSVGTNPGLLACMKKHAGDPVSVSMSQLDSIPKGGGAWCPFEYSRWNFVRLDNGDIYLVSAAGIKRYVKAPRCDEFNPTLYPSTNRRWKWYPVVEADLSGHVNGATFEATDVTCSALT